MKNSLFRLNEIRSWFEGLESAEGERMSLMMAAATLGKENPLSAMRGEDLESVEIVVSEFADEFAGQTIAILRFLDLEEAQRIIEYCLGNEI